MNNIYVAKLGKTVGLKGYLKLHIDSDFPEQFKAGAQFSTSRKLTLKVKDYNSNKNTILFENYEDIDLAKVLTNQELYTSVEETKKACDLGKNEFFWFDLVNCEVYEDNLLLGKVSQVHRYPSSDYLEINTDKNLIQKELPKVFLIPFLFDTYILNVDVENKKIIVQKSYEILENS